MALVRCQGLRLHGVRLGGALGMGMLCPVGTPRSAQAREPWKTPQVVQAELR